MQGNIKCGLEKSLIFFFSILPYTLFIQYVCALSKLLQKKKKKKRYHFREICLYHSFFLMINLKDYEG